MSSTHGTNTDIQWTCKKQGWNMSTSVMHRTAWKDYYTDDVGVYMGMDSLAAGGLPCSTHQQYIDFSAPSLHIRRRMMYAHTVSPATDNFRWYVAAKGSTPNIIWLACGVPRNGTPLSNDEILKWRIKSDCVKCCKRRITRICSKVLLGRSIYNTYTSISIGLYSTIRSTTWWIQRRCRWLWYWWRWSKRRSVNHIM